MPSHSIAFRHTNYFSSLICDYLDEKEGLADFYNRFPTLSQFEDQIKEKSIHFASVNRSILETVLLRQYAEVDASLETHNNIINLRKSNTFTVTTGHQLNLFTGPLYFLYKIISTINLTRQLKQAYPDYNFVPVYWMATEDHDFDEINYFNFKGKKLRWNRDASGAVGRMDNGDLELVAEVFASQLPKSKNAIELRDLFEQAYRLDNNLTQATRFLANELFGDNGLVIIDGDDPDLKRLFLPYLRNELFSKGAFEHVRKTNKKLEQLDYKIQVNPREINLFYLVDNLRERIVETDGIFKVNNSSIQWDKTTLLEELDQHPERFSPNVITRPLYQEVILPNLCYIGGGGELAYWMQLKTYFESQKIVFPILLLRNSVLLINSKQMEKLDRLDLAVADLFEDQNAILNAQTHKRSSFPIDLSEQKKHLKAQFKDMYSIAKKTDKSFLGAVGAQERKQIKGLEHLEKRLLKAQKRRLHDELNRIKSLQDELFPNKSLQERQLNFSEFYLEHGRQLIKKLTENLDPLSLEFLILEL
ncbi:MAG: bacillithiol biosynthesis cysteine-adding enzyme BshC [Flavobacteriaceae bacterium]|nr:bacillithiol biosynthesis cysteine-adding enzyme BshC [Flavobacteriaceae bacterium]NNK72920.1 bacillithiol biosynthesis cysteine-adding enzyme BshC [Flavobacteriaceae bacterium]